VSETHSPGDWYGAPVDEDLVRICAHNLLAAVDEAIYFKDPQGRFLMISRGQALRLGAASPAEVVGHSDVDYFGPEHAAKSAADEETVFRTGQPLVNSLELISMHGAHPKWVTATKMVLRDFDGTPIGTFGISHDITRQVEAEHAAEATSEALAESHAELERRAKELTAIAEVARAAYSAADVRTTVCTSTRTLTGAAIVMLLEPNGKGQLALTGQAGIPLPLVSTSLNQPSIAAAVYRSKTPRIVVDAYADPDMSQSIVDVLESATGQQVRGAVFMPLVIDEKCLGVLVSVLPPGTPDGSKLVPVLQILAQEAATALDRADLLRRLQEQATHDVLTGLSNRRAILELLDQSIARARRHNRGLGLFYLDLDGFKTVNDSYGHAAGDAVLVEVANRLREATRLEDNVGRIGGDEFVVICEDISGAGDAIRTRLAESISKPFSGPCVEVPVGVSVGVAIWQPDDDADALLGRADHAMYADKAARGAWPGSLPSSAVLRSKPRV
jgi:diguanylate cyclase (GGDEF)-like protein/PAS domain S-box-containing protein